MSQISKYKLRSLPYQSRLTISLTQPDFIKEVELLFLDYPDINHIEAQKLLFNKCNLVKLTHDININIIDLDLLTSHILEICDISSWKDLSDLRTYLNRICNNPKFPIILNKIISNILELCNEPDGIDKILDWFITTAGYINYYDYDIIAEKLIKYSGDERVYSFMNKIVGKIKNPELQREIRDYMCICNIIC